MRAVGFAANDVVTGGDQTDVIMSGDGDDNIQGSFGDDFLFGGLGDDIVRGDAGDDVLVGQEGSDIAIGGEGADTFEFFADQFSAGELDTILDFEVDADQIAIVGSTDVTYNSVTGLVSVDGVEVIEVTADLNVEVFARGNSSIIAGASGQPDAAVDVEVMSPVDDDVVLTGGRGRDILEGGSGNDVLSGGRARDLLDGGEGNDVLNGGRGRDALDGGSGDDALNGGGGRDVLNGGEGNDILTGGAGNDVFVFADGGGDDVVTDFRVGSDALQISTDVALIGIESEGGTTLEIDGATLFLENVALDAIINQLPDDALLAFETDSLLF